MGVKTKLAKGPNPLSMRKKTTAAPGRKENPGSIKKNDKDRRPRKGKRSKVLSALKQNA